MSNRAYCDREHPGGDREANQHCEVYHRPELPKALAETTLPTLAQVHDAFIAETRGEGGRVNQAGELFLGTVRGIEIVVYLDTWTYYGPIWNARLEFEEQDFSVPLLEGPHADVHQSVEDALPGIVAWMRQITDSVAEKMDPLDA